jgi:hypothetical protein
MMLPLASVVSLGAVAASTKLGGLALLAVVGLFAIYLVRRGVSWRARIVLFALPALIILGWMIRGVVLSGWLVFPVFGRIALPWAVRPKVALLELQTIESWARMPGRGPSEVFPHGFWFWFGPWFDGFRASRELPLFIVSVASFAWRIPPRTVRFGLRRKPECAALAACLLGLLQWFIGAPDLRYGGFLF